MFAAPQLLRMGRVCAILSEDYLSELGIKERRIGSVTILDSDALLRIGLRFGKSSVPLADAASSLLLAGQKNILLNLDGVESISAKNLGELVSTYVVIKNGGGQFKLFNLTPTVRQLMRATNLLAVFGFYESEVDALSSFADSSSSTPPEASSNPAEMSWTNSPKATR